MFLTPEHQAIYERAKGGGLLVPFGDEVEVDCRRLVAVGILEEVEMSETSSVFVATEFGQQHVSG